MKSKNKKGFTSKLGSSFIAKMLSGIFVITVIVCTTLTVIIASTANKYIDEGVSESVSHIAEKNAQYVEFSVNDILTAAENFVTYFNSNYQESTAADEIYTSYANPNEKVSFNGYMTEWYFYHYAKELVDNNDLLTAFSLYMEPGVISSSFDVDYRNTYYNDIPVADNTKDIDNHFTREDYNLVLSTGKMDVSDPITPDDRTLLVLMYPVTLKGKTVGVIQIGLDLSYFANYDYGNQYETIDSEILTGDGTILYVQADPTLHPGMNFLETYDDPSEFQNVLDTIATSHSKTMKDEEYFEVFFPIKIGDQTWISTTSVETQELEKTSATLRRLAILTSVICVIAMLLIVGFVLRHLLKPLNDTVKAMDTLAEGNLNTRIETKQKDEFGRLADSYNNSVSQLKTIVTDIDSTLSSIANGDLSISYDNSYPNDFEHISDALKNILGSLNGTMAQINLAASQVANGSVQISNASQALAQGATEQASAVDELNATVNDIYGQAQANTEKSQAVATAVTDAGEAINNSNAKMKELTDAMEDMTNKSNEISKIVKTIEDIAFQTNILALNAAVEAARAGTAGKGFAVVADEVRNLATKSSEAASETTKLIGETITAINNGSKIAMETANDLENVVSQTAAAAGDVREIASASEAQSSAISQVKVGIEQISVVVATNSATSEESAAASEELSGQAAQLDALLSQFRLEGSAPKKAATPKVDDEVKLENTPKPVAKAAAKPVARPESKPVSKPESKPVSKPVAKPIAKPTESVKAVGKEEKKEKKEKKGFFARLFAKKEKEVKVEEPKKVAPPKPAIKKMAPKPVEKKESAPNKPEVKPVSKAPAKPVSKPAAKAETPKVEAPKTEAAPKPVVERKRKDEPQFVNVRDDKYGL